MQYLRQSVPLQAISFVWNNETYTRAPEIDAEKCNGCGACQVLCPGTPEDDPASAVKAIMVERINHTL